MSARWPAQINSQRFKRTSADILAVSVSEPTHCYAELAVSSPAVAETTAVTHFTHFPQRDGQNEWYKNTGMVDPPKVVTNPSTNRTRRTFTLLMWLTPLTSNSHLFLSPPPYTYESIVPARLLSDSVMYICSESALYDQRPGPELNSRPNCSSALTTYSRPPYVPLLPSTRASWEVNRHTAEHSDLVSQVFQLCGWFLTEGRGITDQQWSTSCEHRDEMNYYRFFSS